jgi:Uma2 family endonuclease
MGATHQAEWGQIMYAEQLDNDQPLRMTEAEYLAFADAQEFKYEYANGEVIAMSGGSVRHGILGMSAGTHLSILLGERDCTVTNSDVRVFIAHKQIYRYPDVTVFCGDPAYREGRTDTLTNPVLLVEVLSPSTAAIDYSEKLAEYTRIPSLQAYVLISQDEPKIEVYQPHTSGKWLYDSAIGMEAQIAVTVAGSELQLSLAEIYRRVRWDDDPQPDETPSETDDTNE